MPLASLVVILAPNHLPVENLHLHQQMLYNKSTGPNAELSPLFHRFMYGLVRIYD